MSDKNIILFLGLLLLISESLVMVVMHFLGMGPNHWLELLWDFSAVSVIVISAIAIWLKFGSGVTLARFGVVAAKIALIILITETGLMLALHTSGLAPTVWPGALLDGILFAVMAAPIIYHWALKPVIRERHPLSNSLPIQMCMVIAFAALMFDLTLPLGVAGGIPYVMLVLVGFWFPYRNAPFVLALLGTALTVVGYLFSEQGAVYWVVLTNRVLAIFIIWITAVLVMKSKAKTAEIENSRNELEIRVKERTKELRDSETQYRRLVENTPEILYSFSKDSGGLYYSPHVEDILGWSPEYLHDHPYLWHDNIHPDDRPFVDIAIKGLEDGESFDLEYRIRDANKNWHWLHDRNIVIQEIDGMTVFDGLAADITERKQAEEKLHESEARLGVIVERAPVPMVIIDLDGNIEFFNAKFVEKFGWTTNDIRTPEEWWDAAYPDPAYRQEVQETWESSIAEAKESGKEIKPQHWRLTCKNGDVRDVEFQLTPLDEVSVITMIDLTKRVRAEHELIRHRDHLEELVAERTADVQEKAAQLEVALTREKEYNLLQKKFIALVSHEFRTPLAIIDGAAQRLLRRKASLPADEVEARVGKIRSAVTRMVDQIDTTLYASLLDEGKIDFVMLPCDLANVLVDVCERQSELTPDYQIKVMVDDLPDKVRGDTKLLDQVFTNLLSNAVKYSPATSYIEVKGWQDEGMAMISISDQGVGISKDDLPHMFERFFRAKTAEGIKGTGIGLSVVKEFVDIHGGTISLDSVEGQGSTFAVRLPING